MRQIALRWHRARARARRRVLEHEHEHERRLEQDPDLANMRELPRFKALLEKIG